MTSRVRSASSASSFVICSTGACSSMASSRLVTATPKSLSNRRVSSLGMRPPSFVRSGCTGRAPARSGRSPPTSIVWSARDGRGPARSGRAPPTSIEGQLGHVAPARLALRLEVLRVHEVEAVMEVHLELPAAIAVVEVGHGVVEKRAHRVTAEPDEPLEPDRAGEGFLDADGCRELGPHAREFLEELAARRALDAVIHEGTAEIGLEELPAPGGNHCGASVSWAQRAELRAGAPVLRDGDAPRG